MDNIALYTNFLDEHSEKLNKLILRLTAENLSLQPDTYDLSCPEVGYLEHMIDKRGVCMDPTKIGGIKNFPVPKNPQKIKQFTTLAEYYRKFFKGFSKIATP